MKIFFLMLLITDVNGNETLQRANNIDYKSYLSCKVEQQYHRSSERMKFYCVDSVHVTKK